jgi:ubiquinone/menaquinone biosynthesis C-methylase UbiE
MKTVKEAKVMNLPKIEIDVELIYEIQEKSLQYSILMAAIEHKVFSNLTAPLPSDQLAMQIQTDPFLTEKLLDALTTMGFVEKKNGHYCNTPFSNMYLVKGRELYQGNVYKFMDRMERNGYTQFSKMLRTGEIPSRKMPFGKQSVKIGAQWVKTGGVQQMTEFLQTLPCFQEARTLLDLCGGSGMFGMAFASLNPNFKVTLFDTPAVAAAAQEFISRYNMQDKVAVMGGDMTKDPIGDEYDIIFVSDGLYFIKQNLTAILQKLRNALSENGTLICRHMEIKADETGPLANVLHNLGSVLMGFGDFMFLENVIPNALQEAGFSKIDSTNMKHMTYTYTVYVAIE